MPSTTKQYRQYIQYRFGESASTVGDWNGAGEYAFEHTDSVSFAPDTYGDWKYRIRNGLSATTALSGQRRTVVLGNNDHIVSERFVTDAPFIRNYTEVRGQIGFSAQGYPDASNIMIESVLNQARYRAINQIRSAQTSLQGLVSAGEFGETVRLVNGAGRGLSSGFRSYLSDVSYLTKGRRFTPQSLIRNIGRLWLEYAFGWKPLLNDIDGAISALVRYSRYRPPYTIIRASAASKESYPLTEETNAIGDYAFVVRPLLDFHYGVKYYGQVAVTQSGPGALAHEFGIRIEEFIPTAWELIPFSFLADYFLNIGAIIEGYAIQSSGVRWLNFGDLRETDLSVDLVGTPLVINGWSFEQQSFRPGTPYRNRHRYVSRLPVSVSALIPSVEFRIPGSSTKWLNIAALATQHADTSRRVRSYRL